MTSAATVRVLVVDPHPIFRIGLEAVLRSDPQIELVGSCESGPEALQLCASLRPALVIMDVDLPGMHGVEACRAVKRLLPEADVLVLTARDDDDVVFETIRAGASGYVLTDITPENLIRAVHAVRRGHTMIHPGIARRVLNRLSFMARDGNGTGGFGDNLTEREVEILVEIANGSTNKEIARKLFVSESTVKSRLRSIFRKIDARDRAQAAAYAIRKGYTR
ncbi:MAG: response regulator transcription factor [Armatimonadota bacterium]|nr:response regulator transcription factor [Armatimonadota bacterium]